MATNYSPYIDNNGFESDFPGGDDNLFYDNQLMNQKLCWVLRNQTDTKVSEGYNEMSITESASTDESNLWEDTEIIRGLVTNTELSLTASNQFTEGTEGVLGSLGSSLQNLYNQNVPELKKMASLGKDVIQAIAGKIGQSISKDVQKVINPLVDTALQDRQLYLSTSLIKTFRGTEFGFTIPQLNTIIYHNQFGNESVLERINRLYNIFTGGFHSLADSTNETLQEFGGMGGLMDSPNQFSPDFDLIGTNKDIKGTFKLKYGPMTYNNLLVTNYEVTLSTYNALDETGDDSGKPLYAKISISLTPASLYIRSTFKDMLKNWNRNI